MSSKEIEILGNQILLLKNDINKIHNIVDDVVYNNCMAKDKYKCNECALINACGVGQIKTKIQGISGYYV